VFPVSMAVISFGGVDYRRSDMDKLLAAIEKKKLEKEDSKEEE